MLPQSIFKFFKNSRFGCNLHEYFNIHICPSFQHPVRTVKLPIPAVVSQNVTNKNFVVYAKGEKYASWATLRLLGSMRQGEAELCTLHDQVRGS